MPVLSTYGGNGFCGMQAVTMAQMAKGSAIDVAMVVAGSHMFGCCSNLFISNHVHKAHQLAFIQYQIIIPIYNNVGVS